MRFIRSGIFPKFVPEEDAIRLGKEKRKDARLVELVLRESSGIVRAAPHVLVTRHILGHVMANSGIDRFNIRPREIDRALLLPLDPRVGAAIAGCTGW